MRTLSFRPKRVSRALFRLGNPKSLLQFFTNRWTQSAPGTPNVQSSLAYTAPSPKSPTGELTTRHGPSRRRARDAPRLRKSLKRKGWGLGKGGGNFLQKVSPSLPQFFFPQLKTSCPPSLKGNTRPTGHPGSPRAARRSSASSTRSEGTARTRPPDVWASNTSVARRLSTPGVTNVRQAQCLRFA